MGILISLCVIEALGCIGAALFYNAYHKQLGENKILNEHIKHYKEEIEKAEAYIEKLESLIDKE